jgi:hypothetical protein
VRGAPHQAHQPRAALALARIPCGADHVGDGDRAHEIGGDRSGDAAELLERDHPVAVALEVPARVVQLAVYLRHEVARQPVAITAYHVAVTAPRAGSRR